MTNPRPATRLIRLIRRIRLIRLIATTAAALLLTALPAAHPQAQAASTTRTSAFEYDPATGLLTKEIIEPDNPQQCLVTTYGYDEF